MARQVLEIELPLISFEFFSDVSRAFLEHLRLSSEPLGSFHFPCSERTPEAYLARPMIARRDFARLGVPLALNKSTRSPNFLGCVWDGRPSQLDPEQTRSAGLVLREKDAPLGMQGGFRRCR